MPSVFSVFSFYRSTFSFNYLFRPLSFFSLLRSEWETGSTESRKREHSVSLARSYSLSRLLSPTLSLSNTGLISVKLGVIIFFSCPSFCHPSLLHFAYFQSFCVYTQQSAFAHFRSPSAPQASQGPWLMCLVSSLKARVGKCYMGTACVVLAPLPAPTELCLSNFYALV